jgi:fucose permease
MPRPQTALILIAFVAFVSLGLPDGVLGVAWPSVRRTFDVPVSQFGLLLIASTCGFLVSSFSSGAVVRRLGVGRLLLASSGLMTCASAGYALAPSWPFMVALGVFAGLGSGAIDAGINAYAAHHFSPRLVNWLHAFYGVGATLGPLLMTGVLAAGLAWRWGYAVNAAALGLMSLCFLFTLRLWDQPTGETAAAAAAAERPAPDEPAGTFATLRRPVVALSVVLFFLYTGVEVAAGQWAYSLFTEARGVTPAAAGVWAGVYWASLTAGRIAFGAAAGRVPPLAILRVTMVVAPLGALLIWADAAPLANFLGLALMGFCFAPMFRC